MAPEATATATPAARLGFDDVSMLVDGRFGPVRDLVQLRLSGPEPSWAVAMSTLGRVPIGAWHGEVSAGAAGTSVDADEAYRRCVGEVLERFSALDAPIDGHLQPPDLDGITGRFPRCAHDEPCPDSFRTFDPAVPLTHVSMARLADGAVCDVPAGFVHLNFWPEPPEPPVALAISTGLAFHTTPAAAIWNGLCEVAERDAMMLNWWLRRPAPEIRLDGDDVPEVLHDRLERLAAVGLTAQLFDISTDFRVPTVYCIVAGSTWPRAAIGAACRADPLSACAKALDEAVSERVALRAQPRLTLPSLTDFGWVERLDQHAAIYADGTLDHALDFLRAPDRERVPYRDFAAGPWWPEPSTFAELAARAEELERAGLTVLWLEVTAPEVAPFGHVVKVVVPEMVPLSASHSVRWLATPRLTALGGHRPTDACYPYPHPFA